MNFKIIVLFFTILFIFFMFLIPLAFKNKIKENLKENDNNILISYDFSKDSEEEGNDNNIFVSVV